MINCVIFLLIAVICQVGLLRVWFDSYLFRDIQKFLLSHRTDETTFGILCYLATCWQCSGIWTGWIVCFVMAAFLPDSPVRSTNIPMVLLFGFAVGIMSEMVEAFIISRIPRPYQEESYGETEEVPEERELQLRSEGIQEGSQEDN